DTAHVDPGSEETLDALDPGTLVDADAALGMGDRGGDVEAQLGAGRLDGPARLAQGDHARVVAMVGRDDEPRRAARLTGNRLRERTGRGSRRWRARAVPALPAAAAVPAAPRPRRARARRSGCAGRSASPSSAGWASPPRRPPAPARPAIRAPRRSRRTRFAEGVRPRRGILGGNPRT